MRMVVRANSRNFVTFDFEVSKILTGDFRQWGAHRPFGIICASMVFDGHDPVFWFSTQDDGSIASQMRREDLIRMVMYLKSIVDKGWRIVSWNGLGFGFDVLAEESGCWDECRALALNHTDMMFHIFCDKGHRLALDTAARGIGCINKIDEGMSSELATVLWKHGQFQKVLNYVAQNATIVLEVAKAGNQAGKISWVNNRGILQSLMLPYGWLTVRQAMGLPLPDTSWMSNPISRTEFIGWTTTPPMGHLPESSRQVLVTQQKPLGHQDSHPIGRHAPGLRPREICENEQDTICRCPICQGAPDLDLIFQFMFEDDLNDHDSDYYGEWDD